MSGRLVGGGVLAFVLVWGGTLGVTASAQEFDLLVEELGSEKYAAREAAQQGLADWLREDFPVRSRVVHGLMQSTDDPEVKVRCRAILKKAFQKKWQSEGPGFMGIVMSEIPVRLQVEGENIRGVGVREVQPEMPAHRAGIRAGDLLTMVDEVALDGDNANKLLQDHVSEVGAGNEIVLSLIRRGELLKVPLVLVRCPRQVEFSRRHKRPLFRQDIPSEELLGEEDFQQWLDDLPNADAGGLAGAEEDGEKGDREPPGAHTGKPGPKEQREIENEMHQRQGDQGTER